VSASGINLSMLMAGDHDAVVARPDRSGSISTVVAPTDGPTLADWLQGWGTVAGALFAALAAVAAVAVLMHDRAVRRNDEADAAAAQARGVLVLVDADWDEREITEATFIVKNFSSNVILDISLGYRPRNGLRNLDVDMTGSDYLGPGDSSKPWVVRLDPPVPIATDLIPPGVMPPDVIPTRVAFTDAAGRRWRRDGRAQPVRLGSDEDADIIGWARAGDR
jgi:hypothetical protein